jgi:hypothetical protein
VVLLAVAGDQEVFPNFEAVGRPERKHTLGQPEPIKTGFLSLPKRMLTPLLPQKSGFVSLSPQPDRFALLALGPPCMAQKRGADPPAPVMDLCTAVMA